MPSNAWQRKSNKNSLVFRILIKLQSAHIFKACLDFYYKTNNSDMVSRTYLILRTFAKKREKENRKF